MKQPYFLVKNFMHILFHYHIGYFADYVEQANVLGMYYELIKMTEEECKRKEQKAILEAAK